MSSSSLSHVTAPDGVAPGNGYSHVVHGTGRCVAVSGQMPLDAQGELVGAGDPLAQARQVFTNIGRCLTAAGAGFGDVAKLTYYVTDIAVIPALRTARDEVIDTARPPASTAVQVAALVRPDILMEVEALAIVPEGA
ncbi:RidA family protein [Streptomyces sp. MST-110588]|uniref:RidA family protein n=1 Tax=Streptomyces sp. MST-110588 TaxID=2833628 RepID=UPI001F5DF107|nr:RidA family protein [Streptomyces sp. MST-110588]UNO39266.1 RidA family protein [Streptomyces sp. MST-110588]